MGLMVSSETQIVRGNTDSKEKIPSQIGNVLNQNQVIPLRDTCIVVDDSVILEYKDRRISVTELFELIDSVKSMKHDIEGPSRGQGGN
jgi:hypothetical protein